jgi:hypothetical protein
MPLAPRQRRPAQPPSRTRATRPAPWWVVGAGGALLLALGHTVGEAAA